MVSCETFILLNNFNRFYSDKYTNAIRRQVLIPRNLFGPLSHSYALAFVITLKLETRDDDDDFRYIILELQACNVLYYYYYI
jgi:hypothetical protein